MPEAALQAGVEPAAPVEPMTLLQHLEELRKRVVYSLIGLVLGFGVCFSYAEEIFNYMQAPILEVLRRHQMDDKLVYLNPTEPFNLYLKVAIIAGLFVASPIVLYQVWMFISPGLYRNEKRYVIPFMVFAVGLFVSGGYFGYAVAYPAALDFLIGYGGAFRPMITVSEYTSLFLAVIVGLGLIFEMPIIIFFLALMGVVDARFLWNNVRYAILIMFIVAAVITPTTDLMNMMIFAAPMIALYLLSIGIAWFVHPKRRATA
jgi:sec-independent protein translocase protein TatC